MLLSDLAVMASVTSGSGSDGALRNVRLFLWLAHAPSPHHRVRDQRIGSSTLGCTDRARLLDIVDGAGARVVGSFEGASRPGRLGRRRRPLARPRFLFLGVYGSGPAFAA